MIHVIATIELAAGKRDAFLEQLRPLITQVHAEKGCLEYAPAVDLQTNVQVQPPVRPDVVIMIEKWEDLPSLEAHLIAPHMVEYRKNVKDLVQKTEVCILEPA